MNGVKGCLTAALVTGVIAFSLTPLTGSEDATEHSGTPSKGFIELLNQSKSPIIVHASNGKKSVWNALTIGVNRTSPITEVNTQLGTTITIQQLHALEETKTDKEGAPYTFTIAPGVQNIFISFNPADEHSPLFPQTGMRATQNRSTQFLAKNLKSSDITAQTESATEETERENEA